MSTGQCQRLHDALLYARSRPTRVLVFMGGPDYFSNGIHLNVIEAAESPADESWRNINAMNDLVHDVITIEDKLSISALGANAGAGGVTLAAAADLVWARPNVVLNPHYKGMGGLYGSEYWTYLLPRRVGERKALELTEGMLPLGAFDARKMGLVDDIFQGSPATFQESVVLEAEALAHGQHFWAMLAMKVTLRRHDERRKPLAQYRDEELARMRENFYGQDPSYHEARLVLRPQARGPDRGSSAISASGRNVTPGASCFVRHRGVGLGDEYGKDSQPMRQTTRANQTAINRSAGVVMRGASPGIGSGVPLIGRLLRRQKVRRM
jgi:putative two-component system hydrogenase maturation factor HypX/HoxX